MLTVDRYLVDLVTPGTRVSVVGVSSLFNSGATQKLQANAVRTSYLRVIGIQVTHYLKYIPSDLTVLHYKLQ